MTNTGTTSAARRIITTAALALGLTVAGTMQAQAATTTDPTCYTVQHDAHSAVAFLDIVESGAYSADDAAWVGQEDSTIVNVGIWLHDVMHGVAHPTFVEDSFPICE